MKSDKARVAIVVSHPIQHFCPQYASYAGLNYCAVKVFFGSAMGKKPYFDKSFDKVISWSNLNLEAFDHEFLNGEKILPADKNLDAPNLDQALNNFSPEILITYGYFQKLQLRAQRWAKNNDIPVAIISDSENKRKRRHIVNLIKRLYIPARLKNINYYLTVGDANEEYYRNYGASDEQFIRCPFPIDVLTFDPIYVQKEEYRKSVRSNYHIPEDAFVLSVAGKLESFKRQEDVIRAFQTIQHPGKRALFIIGAGPDEARLKALARNFPDLQIIFTGFIEPEQLPQYYAATDLYIHPSEMDAHSLSVSEAIYMGCPVIISNSCGSYGTSDDVQHGKNGFVFQMGNIRQISTQIRYLMEKKPILEKFSSCSREIAVSNQLLAHGRGLEVLIECVNLNRAKTVEP